MQHVPADAGGNPGRRHAACVCTHGWAGGKTRCSYTSYTMGFLACWRARMPSFLPCSTYAFPQPSPFALRTLSIVLPHAAWSLLVQWFPSHPPPPPLQGIGLQLMQCSGCRTERYCSADCQVQLSRMLLQPGVCMSVPRYPTSRWLRMPLVGNLCNRSYPQVAASPPPARAHAARIGRRAALPLLPPRLL